jgi:hypothetical protein
MDVVVLGLAGPAAALVDRLDLGNNRIDCKANRSKI